MRQTARVEACPPLATGIQSYGTDFDTYYLSLGISSYQRVAGKATRTPRFLEHLVLILAGFSHRPACH